jgi:hypothetical protein
MVRRGILSTLLSGLALVSCPLAADQASPFGVNIHAPEQERLQFALDQVAAAGIGWVRIDFVWADVEPEPGVERWLVYDELVAAARARDLRVLALIAYTPAWATDGPAISGVPRHVGDWSDFCYRAASRYRGEIAFWEVWNEPNLDRFWSGSRAEYIDRILAPAARALRAANPDARVGGPALAHHVADGRDWHGWLLDVLRAAGSELDFVTHHLYDLEDPAAVLARLAGETPFGDDPSRWGEAEPSLGEVLAQVAFERPVWLTETGWTTTRLDESRQGDHYQRFLDLWLAGEEPPAWPDKVFFYELQDDPDPQVPKFGLLRVSGRPKPAYQVLRDFIAAQAPPPGDAEPPSGPPVAQRPRTRILPAE